jgi:hypothetical protein
MSPFGKPLDVSRNGVVDIMIPHKNSKRYSLFFFGDQNRINIAINEIPEHIIRKGKGLNV